MASVIITSAITRYGFRYNFIKVFGVADIFRYPISITLVCRNLLRSFSYISSILTGYVMLKVTHIHHILWRVKLMIFKNWVIN